MIDMVKVKKRYLEFLTNDLEQQIEIIASVFLKLEESFLNDQKPTMEEIQRIKNEKHDQETEYMLIEYVSEDGQVLEEMKHLAQANVVTMLYHYLENQIKKALKVVRIPKRISELDKLLERMEILKVITNRSLDLVCYNEIQEVRKINNLYKHDNGIADAALAQINSKWVEGDKIIVSESDIIRFKDYVNRFLSSLISQTTKFVSKE